MPPSSASPRPIRVLTLGDGNFSFSLALLRLYCPTKRERDRRLRSSPTLPMPLLPDEEARLQLVCTVFDSEEQLSAKYPETGQGVVEELSRRGAEVLFNVDATAIDASMTAERERGRQQRHDDGVEEEKDHDTSSGEQWVSGSAGLREFDCVVFHHPHSGREDVLYHRRLLSHFLHSAAAVSHRSSLVLLSLCDRQPWQWRLQESAQLNGWEVCDMGGWEAEMAEWAALGYESKRHHTGRQFNAHHVTHRHKVTLRRAQADSDAQQASESWRAQFGLLLRRAQPYGSEQVQQWTRKSEEAAEEPEALTAAGEPLDALCPICRQSHSRQANRVQPRPAQEGAVVCEVCNVAFTNERALAQHTAAMAGRDDHIALSAGEGKRTRHRKLREEGIVTQEMRERGERINAKKQQRRSRLTADQGSTVVTAAAAGLDNTSAVLA